MSGIGFWVRHLRFYGVKIMGLDFGHKRIGVALSDDLCITAQALTVIERKGVESHMADITDLIAAHNVLRIVVGLPVNMNGSVGPQARKALDLARSLEARTGLPVDVWDERLTTRSAEAALVEAGTRRSRRRQVVDKVAAQIMLQHYLDRRRSGDIEKENGQ